MRVGKAKVSIAKVSAYCKAKFRKRVLVFPWWALIVAASNLVITRYLSHGFQVMSYVKEIVCCFLKVDMSKRLM
jgi:hypothetical protein